MSRTRHATDHETGGSDAIAAADIGAAATGHDHDADYEATGAIATHSADTTSVHGITDTSALVVDGDAAGGELAGTYPNPTVASSHSGSTHAATQAAAEATAAGALSTHEGGADPHTGYRLESADHSHASTGLQAGKLAQANTHESPDTDTGPTSLHHTLGTGANQSAAGNHTHTPALTSASAFATAETTISAATYADITGCSVSLAAGTWLVMGHVVCRAVNAIVQAFGAITDGANAVVAESAASRPASGTANLNSPFSMSWFVIVSPGSTTTYKLRAARGLTTHTASWIAMDGTGFNTTNHASNNTDKGTGIIAIRIA